MTRSLIAGLLACFVLLGTQVQAQYDTQELITLHRTAVSPETNNILSAIRWTGTEIIHGTPTLINSYELIQDGNARWAATHTREGMLIREIFLGEQGWTVIGAGNQESVREFTIDRPYPAARQARWASPLLSAEQYQYEPAYKGQSRSGGGMYEEVMITAKNNDGFMVYLDPETYLVHHIRDWRIVDGKLQTIDIVYSDYREVEGELLPFRWEYVQQGEVTITYQMQTAEANPAIDPGFWKSPVRPPLEMDPADDLGGRR